MSKLKIKVNDKEVLTRFKALGSALQSDKLKTATQAGALIVVNAAKGKVRYKSGTLRRSIHMEVIKSTQDRCEVRVGTDVIYARIHEYGGRGISAQPYMRPAIDDNREAIQQEIVASIKDLLGGF